LLWPISAVDGLAVVGSTAAAGSAAATTLEVAVGSVEVAASASVLAVD
jgi:hypothetical protein